MADQPNDRPNLEIRGLAEADVIFAEGYQGWALRSGILHLNLFSLRNDPASSAEHFRAAAGILAMPIVDFCEVVESLNGIVAQLEKDGLIIRKKPDGTAGEKPASH